MNEGFLRRIMGWVRGNDARRANADAPAFAAVTVTSTGTFCEAARATTASPILLSTGPKLPLPDCSMPDQCLCRLRHWPDRRIGERRLLVNAESGLPPPDQAKPRSGRDRRRK